MRATLDNYTLDHLFRLAVACQISVVCINYRRKNGRYGLRGQDAKAMFWFGV